MKHTSGDGAALLRAICDHPDEDTPRLVYADWLDEQGGESNAARAEFIRIQIAEAEKARRKNMQSVGLRSYRIRPVHERELLRRYIGDWSIDLPMRAGVRYDNSSEDERFERGFPWQVHAPDVDTFLKIAPAMFAVAPITYLSLGNLKIGAARKLAESPHLARIRQWQDVYLRRTDKMLAEIGKSPHLANLREIDLTGAQITAAGVRALLFAPAIRAVTRLCFSSCEIGDEGVEVIAHSPACANLEHLNLTYRRTTAVGVRALAASPARQSMCSLLLTQTQLDDDATVELAAVEWPRLEYLLLGVNRLTDRSAEAFLNSAFWRSSGCDLWLTRNQLSDAVKAKLKEVFGPRVSV